MTVVFGSLQRKATTSCLRRELGCYTVSVGTSRPYGSTSGRLLSPTCRVWRPRRVVALHPDVIAVMSSIDPMLGDVDHRRAGLVHCTGLTMHLPTSCQSVIALLRNLSLC